MMEWTLATAGDVIDRYGLWVALLPTFVIGLSLNLTPCVYPMVPVTLAFFSGQAAGSWRRIAGLASCYVVGISLSYALLGLFAAQTGALLGSWLQQPAVLIGVAAVVAALALSLFGFYEFRLPQVLLQRMGRAASGPLGALLMGLVLGLVAAPCIGPFVVGLLLIVGQLADPPKGFLLFFTLGLGMGTPYIVLALIAHRMGRLPKAGAWLVWIKQLLGVVLLGLVLYLLRPLLPSSAETLGAAILLAGAGLLLGWLYRTADRGRAFTWVRRLMGSALLVAALAVVWPRSASAPGVAWTPYSEAAFAQAVRDQRPIVIDFYADWCVPCVELDHVTFRHPTVVAALAETATLRADATHELTPDAEALVERYDIYGVPTVLLFDRTGAERRDLRLLGFVPPDEFLELVRQLQ